MCPMDATADALRRLGELVTARRTKLRLSVRAAGRLAGSTNTTWQRVEDGKSVRDLTYAAVEYVLRWDAGSCKAVLAGGEPTVIDDNPPQEAPRQDAEADEQPELIANGDGYEEWKPAVATDLRDAVRDAVMVVLPDTPGRDIQAMEEAVEEHLRRRIAMRRGDAT